MGTKCAAARIREWRERAGLTQTEVAAQIGDESGQFQRWESGNRPTLPLKMKVRLSFLSGVPLSDVVDLEELALARELVAIMARDAAA